MGKIISRYRYFRLFCNGNSGFELKFNGISGFQTLGTHPRCGAAMLVKFAHGEYERAFEQCRGEDSITTFSKTLKRQVERVLRYKIAKWSL